MLSCVGEIAVGMHLLTLYFAFVVVATFYFCHMPTEVNFKHFFPGLLLLLRGRRFLLLRSLRPSPLAVGGLLLLAGGRRALLGGLPRGGGKRGFSIRAGVEEEPEEHLQPHAGSPSGIRLGVRRKRGFKCIEIGKIYSFGIFLYISLYIFLYVIAEIGCFHLLYSQGKQQKRIIPQRGRDSICCRDWQYLNSCTGVRNI